MDCAPEVTGVSPCEGYPDTKVKIWGENLGTSAADVVSVVICGVECVESIEWVSERKIVCNSGKGHGRGRVIVETITGGKGSCTVYFTGLEHSAPQSPRVDPQMESAVWVEEEWNLFEGFGTANQPLVSEVLPAKTTDPLGIFRRGITEKMSEESIRQVCPNGSGNLLADNFNPVMYLLENHCTISFTQLKDGLNNLQREVEQSRLAPAGFIRDNLSSFIQCFDTLSDVNTLLIRNESETETGSITDKVEGLLNDTTLHADALFQGLIKRKMKADATRNTLTVLQRYRFLFNLPKSIERNIKHREYEIVTNDYERAKSLFSGTKVKVFAKVLKEVESLVAKLRTDLKKELMENPSTLEDQKKLIKYLLDLDYLGDPAWECLNQMNQWILDLLTQCKNNYQLQLPTVTGSEEYLHTLSSNSYTSETSVKGAVDPSSFSFGTTTDASKPQRILFVEKLIEIASDTLPNFYKLGQAYFNQTLFPMMLNENQDAIISDNMSSKSEVFEGMIMVVCEIFTDMVNVALFEDDAIDRLPEERVAKLGHWRQFDDILIDSSGAWLPLCVRKIRSCLGSFQTLRISPAPLLLVEQLSVNVCILCSEMLFERTKKDVEHLYQREDWHIQEEEGTVITGLPILFENIVVDVLLTLKEIVIENPLGVESEELRQPLLDGSVESFQGLLKDFTSCLEHLAFEYEESVTTEVAPVSHISEDMLHKPSEEERLLLIWSNCYYTKHHVVPDLYECFVSHGYPECYEMIEEFKGILDAFGMKVFKAYIDKKMQLLLDIVVPGMSAGYFNWEAPSFPTDVRIYVREALVYLVHVHAEVYSIAPDAVNKVFSQILELLTAEILEELQKIEEMNDEGKLHAFIEVKMFEETLHQYLTESTKKNLLEIYEIIENKDKKMMKMFWNITDVFKENTKFQFKCFQVPKPSSRV